MAAGDTGAEQGPGGGVVPACKGAGDPAVDVARIQEGDNVVIMPLRRVGQVEDTGFGEQYP